MQIIDLSHAISPDMPVYPGTNPPKFSIPCTIEKDGFTETEISIFTHTGTHVDAPAHILKGAETLDHKAINHFIGKACVLDFQSAHNNTISIENIIPFQSQVEKCDFILFHTGHSQLWGTNDYYKDYPVLSDETALWLVDNNIKGIGADVISADAIGDSDFPIHKILLKNSIIIIENLTNLGKIPEKNFIFSCFPLKIENADGSPVRAVAMV
jgi:kynurenine formamidase